MRLLSVLSPIFDPIVTAALFRHDFRPRDGKRQVQQGEGLYHLSKADDRPRELAPRRAGDQPEPVQNVRRSFKKVQKWVFVEILGEIPTRSNDAFHVAEFRKDLNLAMETLKKKQKSLKRMVHSLRDFKVKQLGIARSRTVKFTLTREFNKGLGNPNIDVKNTFSLVNIIILFPSECDLNARVGRILTEEDIGSREKKCFQLKSPNRDQ